MEGSESYNEDVSLMALSSESDELDIFHTTTLI